MATSAPASPVPGLVLDTNAVLDWLVFRDTCAGAFSAAIESGAVRWLACARMREELALTLAYPALAKWNPDSEHTLTTFDRWAEPQADPPPAPLNLRCTDPDDQVFLDLALHAGARWLLTKDRAVLRLARRVRPLGLEILKPGDWRAP